MIETETWQPGKVLTTKINTNHTYLNNMNYWAPLEDNNEENEEGRINIAEEKPTASPPQNKQING